MPELLSGQGDGEFDNNCGTPTKKQKDKSTFRDVVRHARMRNDENHFNIL